MASTSNIEHGAIANASSFHARTVDETLSSLVTDREGLTSKEATERLLRVGKNELAPRERESSFRRLMRQFQDILIYILIVAAVLTAWMGEWIDSGVIAAVVMANALIGYLQEGKAEEALESLRKMLSAEAMVRRDGRRMVLPASELVPGDIVYLESGDRVPADLRVIEQRNARVEEAALTGESEPVSKSTSPVEEHCPLGDRRNMAFSGTVVTHGTLTGVVVSTGSSTELGRIGQLVSEVEALETPLLVAVRRFGKVLATVIVAVSAALFFFGLAARDYAMGELFMVAVSLAVAAIPEGLPAIMTITLALGVQRMAARHAIVRRLPAVETLGSVTVICSDKTGTLTRNEMTVKEVNFAGRRYEVEGVGYAPVGEIRSAAGGPSFEADWAARELALAGILCSHAEVRNDGDAWILDGDPTEGAVVVLGMKLGHERKELEGKRPRLDEIPFESERRFMATLHRVDGEHVAYLKGAPEQVLARCTAAADAEGNPLPIEVERWQEDVRELAAKGYRVLAFAWKNVDVVSLDESAIESMTLLGMVGIIDPPRPEAIRAVAKCATAGIRVKMITGDHALTARSIGAKMGIGDGEKALTGAEIEHLDDNALTDAVQEHDVFARSSPEHKLRLVKALQACNEVVAMTGDGVNDAPALKRADVGVAMGRKGSEAAKDAAEVVLTDDNFTSIERAVEEGRTIYDNLKKTILFILPTNGAQSLMVFAAVVLAFPHLPATPVQILWINMVVAVTLALALAFEPPEADVMQRPPRRRDEPIVSGLLLWRIGSVSVIVAGLSFAAFFRELEGGASLQVARTMAVNVLVAGQTFYLVNSRFIHRSSLSLEGLFGNRKALLAMAVLLLLQLGFTYIPLLQHWFDTGPLPASRWVWISGAGLVVFLLIEVEKAVLRAIRRRRGPGDRGASGRPLVSARISTTQGKEAV